MTRKKNEKSWIVTRLIREKFWVQHAETKSEARDKAADPVEVFIIREGARRTKGRPK